MLVAPVVRPEQPATISASTPRERSRCGRRRTSQQRIARQVSKLSSSLRPYHRRNSQCKGSWSDYSDASYARRFDAEIVHFAPDLLVLGWSVKPTGYGVVMAMARQLRELDEDFDDGSLLVRSHVLPSGARVRLRLTRSRDAGGIRRLLEREQVDAEVLDVARLVRFDPRSRMVFCATALVGSAEEILGIGSIELDGDEPKSPEVLVVEARGGHALRTLLRKALVGKARASADRRAA